MYLLFGIHGMKSFRCTIMSGYNMLYRYCIRRLVWPCKYIIHLCSIYRMYVKCVHIHRWDEVSEIVYTYYKEGRRKLLAITPGTIECITHETFTYIDKKSICLLLLRCLDSLYKKFLGERERERFSIYIIDRSDTRTSLQILSRISEKSKRTKRWSRKYVRVGATHPPLVYGNITQ